jgi:metal-sulfur cluster biosynthetic enzyme
VTGRAQVLAALSTVYDPELDEPLTALGFVASCWVSEDGDVDVHLRLPTPQCAPNFAYLMVADARAAILGIAGVGEVSVVLDGHYTGSEINAAVGDDAGFAGAFPGETDGDLDPLRELFRRKALLARQGRLCEALLAGGATPEAIVALQVSSLPAGPDSRRSVALRRELGLPHGPDAPALIAGDGSALEADDLDRWRRRARLVSLSLESNGGLCRDLLAVRYGRETTEEVAA